MFRVYFTNFHYFSSREADTLEGAKQIARDACFQAQIVNPEGEVVGTYCPMVGYRNWPSHYAA